MKEICGLLAMLMVVSCLAVFTWEEDKIRSLNQTVESQYMQIGGLERIVFRDGDTDISVPEFYKAIAHCDNCGTTGWYQIPTGIPSETWFKYQTCPVCGIRDWE